MINIVMILDSTSLQSSAYLNALLSARLTPVKVLLIEKHIKYQPIIRLTDLCANIISLCLFAWYVLTDLWDYVTFFIRPRLFSKKRFKNGPLLTSYRLTRLIRKHNIDYAYVKGINTNTCIRMLKELKPDVIVPVAGKVSKTVLQIASFGVINIHPGILPKYQGNDPIGWAILNNDNVGLTAHLMDENYDSGAIIQTRECNYSHLHTYESLHYEISVLHGARLLADTLCAVNDGKATLSPQKEGSYWLQMTADQKQQVEILIQTKKR